MAVDRTSRREPPHHATRARLRRLAWWLDSSIPLPGGYRVGFDGVVGLVPGIGDTVAAGLSAYIIAEAARLGASTSVVLRMALNVAFELVVGSVPVLGDLFDFAFKANERNVELLERFLDDPAATRAGSRWTVALALAIVALALAVALTLMIAVLRLLFSIVTG